MSLSQESKERRARNRAAGLAALRQLGTVTIQSKNRGAHLIVITKNGTLFDYWPGTGLWQKRGLPISDEQRGIRSLIERLQREDQPT